MTWLDDLFGPSKKKKRGPEGVPADVIAASEAQDKKVAEAEAAAAAANAPKTPEQLKAEQDAAVKAKIEAEQSAVAAGMIGGAGAREQSLNQATNAWTQNQNAQYQAMLNSVAAQQQNLGNREDLALLRNQALGRGPSAAAQLAQQQGEQIAAQQAAAAWARGSNPATARAAMLAGTGARQNAAMNASQLRSNEQMQGAQLYGQNYGNANTALLNQQTNLMGQQQQMGATGLSNLQSAAAMGQSGNIAGNTVLASALAQRYGTTDIQQQLATQTAIAQMQTQAELERQRLQNSMQPSFWQQMLGGLVQGVGGGLAQGAMGAAANKMQGDPSKNTTAGSTTGATTTGGGGGDTMTMEVPQYGDPNAGPSAMNFSGGDTSSFYKYGGGIKNA